MKEKYFCILHSLLDIGYSLLKKKTEQKNKECRISKDKRLQHWTFSVRYWIFFFYIED